jgi:branched-chain amino acid aminotransferase
MLTNNELQNSIDKLITVNDMHDCNVMLEIYGDTKQEWVLYIRASSYPTRQMYDIGVYMTTLKLTRNLPEAKIMDLDYKKKIEEQLAEKKCYEVILVNDEGYVTEGSRSNIFFIQGNKIYTAPQKHVLRGITSIYAVRACEDAGYKIISELVAAEEIKNMDAAFMTGTSVNILPISQIDKIKLDSAKNTVVKNIMSEFEKYII